MQRFSISFAAPMAALALAAVVAACSGSAAAPSPASPAPSQAPTQVPTQVPVVTPAPTASPAPSEAPSGAPQAQAPVKLDVFLDHDVSVVVTDRGTGLVTARSGQAADGMSVRWGTANVRNLDPKTIEVTWAGYPRDETVGLVILPDGDGVKLRFGQAAPYPNTDAMGADRVMVFTFADAIAAADVAVEFTTTDD
jgi:glucose/arabinose dehydrogenase